MIRIEIHVNWAYPSHLHVDDKSRCQCELFILRVNTTADEPRLLLTPTQDVGCGSTGKDQQ